jgi:hypothetical protein
MLRIVTRVLVLTAACALLANFAFADEGGKQAENKQAKKGPSAEQKFKKLDKDGDGQVTLKEFVGLNEGEAKATRERQFQKMDKNHDGVVTLDEFKSGGQDNGKNKNKGHGKGKKNH